MSISSYLDLFVSADSAHSKQQALTALGLDEEIARLQGARCKAQSQRLATNSAPGDKAQTRLCTAREAQATRAR